MEGRRRWQCSSSTLWHDSTWRSCTRTTPLSPFRGATKDCTLPLGGTVALITQWFPYTGFLAAARYQSSTPAWINSTSTTCPLAHSLRRPHFTGSWPQYAICPIAHCSLPNAHCLQLPTKAGTEPREMGVKSFSVVNKEESFSEREQ